MGLGDIKTLERKEWQLTNLNNAESNSNACSIRNLKTSSSGLERFLADVALLVAAWCNTTAFDGHLDEAVYIYTQYTPSYVRKLHWLNVFFASKCRDDSLTQMDIQLRSLDMTSAFFRTRLQMDKLPL